MNMKKALREIVTAARKSATMDRELSRVGYHDTPYFDIFTSLADAIHALTGEETDDFCKSITYRILTSDALTDKQRVDLLFHETRRNSKLVTGKPLW